MKGWRRLCSAMLSLFLLCAVSVPAKAAEPYTYTVRIFAGQMGTYDGQKVVVYENLTSGMTVDFRMSKASVTDDSKYYVKGIRESGKDSNTSTANLASITVTRDMDFVISYGILGDMTSYTIEYVNQAGQALAPSETYYGNVGDKPVIAYLYIDGYRPQAYNLTKTLVKDASENVFRFVYTPGTVPNRGTTTTTTTETAPAPGPAPEAAGAAPDAAAQGAAPAAGGGAVPVGGGGGAAAAAGGAAAGGAAAAVPDGETPLAEEPQQIQDLDEEVPLSDLPSLFDIGGNASLLGIPMPVVLISVLVLLGGGIFLVGFWKKRKKREEAS